MYEEQLSPHFTLREFTQSPTAIKHGIINQPNKQEYSNLVFLAKQLELVRACVGSAITVSSGFRNERLNALVGGSKTSSHRLALAGDIKAKGYTSMELAQKIKKMKELGLLEFDQLILEFPERGSHSWVHLGFNRIRPQRQQILTAVRSNSGRTVYLNGLKY